MTSAMAHTETDKDASISSNCDDADFSISQENKGKMTRPVGQQSEIKAIETVYKGYKFRSRLEARWAVLLDKLGIKWLYESEGFDLGDGVWYLPDFYLPDIDIWLEIKPDTNYDGAKVVKFAKSKLVACICGQPYKGEYSIHIHCAVKEIADGDGKEYVIAVVLDNDGTFPEIYLSSLRNRLAADGFRSALLSHSLAGDSLMSAYTTARQIRF